MKAARAKAEMREQMRGTLISLCAFILILVWIIDTPRSLRLGVTGLIALIVGLGFLVRWARRSRTDRKRAEQVEKHKSI